MPRAYLHLQGRTAGLDGPWLVVQGEEGPVARWATDGLDAVVVIGRIHCTTPLVQRLLRRRIPVHFLDVRGWYLGRLAPAAPGASGPRIAQYIASATPSIGLPLARAIVDRKIDGSIRFLLQQIRGGVEGIGDVVDDLRRARKRLAHATTLAMLRGVEGVAAKHYWSGFVRSLRIEHTMSGRAMRPPPDPVNAALSFGYALLLTEVLASVELADLDPALGVLHRTRNRRPALALDLMEPFRHVLVDRLVLRLLHRRELRPEHFTSFIPSDEDDLFPDTPQVTPDVGRIAWHLNEEGRAIFVTAFHAAVSGNEGLASSSEDGADHWRDAIRRTTDGFRRELLESTEAHRKALAEDPSERSPTDIEESDDAQSLHEALGPAETVSIDGQSPEAEAATHPT